MLENIWLPNDVTILLDMESHMRDMTYEQTMIDDELEIFPEQRYQQLNQWGLNDFYVPVAYGGKLKSFETLFGLLRLVSRRDLTLAIAHGKTYLGASAIWVAGNQVQKTWIANYVLNQGVVSLGLTEKSHGSDLVSNEVYAKKVTQGYAISGEKWLINNATRGDAITVLAKTSTRNDSLFLINKKNLEPSTYHHLPKIKTHGIRGADISGIGFNNAVVNTQSLISSEGSGLEVTLKSLQISRTMCASLSLGAADTALRSTMKFVHARQLYGNVLTEIPYVKEVIVNAFLDIIISECLSLFALRCLHFHPEWMSLYSSVVKYFVPTQVESVFDHLAGVLGARSYLRETHEHGIFQKCIRDNRLVGLFDGSTMINLQNIANQINAIIQKSTKNCQDKMLLKYYEIICSLNIPVSMFEAEALCLFAHGKELMPYVFELLLRRIHNEQDKNVDTVMIVKLLVILIIERDRLFSTISENSYFHQKLDKEKTNHLQQYCHLVAAGCCAYILYQNAFLSNNMITHRVLLKHCLIRIVSTFRQEDFFGDFSDTEIMWSYVNQLYQENRMFSLMPIRLG